MWPNSTLPQDGDNVTIKKEWKVLLDVQPPRLGHLQIDGQLIVPSDVGDRTIEADSIWVKGTFKAGTSSSPFPNKLLIKINGDRSDRGIVVDSLEKGNKLIVVTGIMLLYGISPATVWTRLNSTAVSGSNTMVVKESSGWEIGDELVIGPSFTSFN